MTSLLWPSCPSVAGALWVFPGRPDTAILTNLGGWVKDGQLLGLFRWVRLRKRRVTLSTYPFVLPGNGLNEFIRMWNGFLSKKGANAVDKNRQRLPSLGPPRRVSPRWVTVTKVLKRRTESRHKSSSNSVALFMTISRRVSVLRLSVALGSLTALMVLALSVPDVSAQAKPSGPNPGLVGLLPDEAPYDLNEESFEALTGKWAPVRTKVSSLVEKLHSDKSLDVVGQQLVL